MAKYTVSFENAGLKVPVEEGSTLLKAAWMAGLNIRSECKGNGVCGKCRVFIRQFQNEPAPELENHEILGQDEIFQGWRLACEVKVENDLKVVVPRSSLDHGVLVRKAYVHRDIECNPYVRRYPLELSPFAPNHGTGLWETCAAVLKENYHFTEPQIAPTALVRLSNLADRKMPPLEAFVTRDEKVICIKQRSERPMLGLALDIGTTSLAAYLGDLEGNRILAADSVLNPQVVYGDDVLARISVVQSNPEKLGALQRSVINAVNGLILNMTSTAGSAPDDIVDVTVVCNTTMHHLFLGLNPEALGRYPFIPTVKTAQYVPSSLLGLNVNPGARVYMFPVFSSYVGGDTVGVRIAQGEYYNPAALVMDIGTNGELVLAGKDRSYCTSCATGPAFEGAQIRHGMRAVAGTVEKVSIDPVTWDVDYRVIPRPGEDGSGNGKPIGICGSGVFSAVAEMYKAGIINETGAFNRDKKHPRLRREKKRNKYEFVLAYREECDMDEDLTVCQDDIRAVQLGKGALLAGAQMLLNYAGLEEPGEIILAGAFGSYVDIDDALTIGMLPRCPREKIRAVGNAAGDGARMALFNYDFREKAQALEEHTEYIELSTAPGFQETFTAALYFPGLNMSPEAGPAQAEEALK